MIVDMRRIKARDGDAGKQMAQQSGAGFREFVEDERTAGKLGEDGEQSGPSGRLQHEVGRSDRRYGDRCEAERDRRRELLECLALLRATGVRRQQVRDSGEQRQHGGRRRCLCANSRAEFAQEQYRRHFARFISGLPVPCARRVGAAEGGLHGGSKHLRIHARAAFEMGKQDPRGVGYGVCRY
jgi:hypothetical protein